MTKYNLPVTKEEIASELNNLGRNEPPFRKVSTTSPE